MQEDQSDNFNAFETLAQLTSVYCVARCLHVITELGIMLDIHMLTLLGGRQRSLQEYQKLLAQAGFRLEREIPTFTGVSILEAVCV